MTTTTKTTRWDMVTNAPRVESEQKSAPDLDVPDDLLTAEEHQALTKDLARLAWHRRLSLPDWTAMA